MAAARNRSRPKFIFHDVQDHIKTEVKTHGGKYYIPVPKEWKGRRVSVIWEGGDDG